MINLNCGPSIMVGLLIIVSFLALYFVRTVKFELARDVDMFYTSLGLIYGSILMIHGWRLDPILLFSQVLLIFITFSFCWILIRQREIIRRLVERI